ncbi:hypothetical protein F5Y18DRAFT_431350 [Xylariaceae sp. FL1019]|nr:hypothetical protein F5Y18DRAFT_431350 [Xylariaceae sp. FL1019]
MRLFALLAINLLRLTVATPFSSSPDALTSHDTLSAITWTSPITWTLPIVEGGANYTFTGTIEEVVDQVNHERAKLGIEPIDDSFDETETPDYSAAHKRTYIDSDCKQGLGGPASDQRIRSGINYLKKLKTTCRNGPGPLNCGRISCSWNSAIYWCNDKATDSQVYDCSMFAEYAQHVRDKCGYKQGKNHHLVWGQARDTDDFRVVVGSDSC